jgi:hypothetical protein
MLIMEILSSREHPDIGIAEGDAAVEGIAVSLDGADRGQSLK